jgi:hypothetical protein
MGLLGTYNGDVRDDTTTPDCSIVPTNYPQNENDARQLYYNFGEKCESFKSTYCLCLHEEKLAPFDY